MSIDPVQVEDPIPAALRDLCPPICVECDYSLVGLPAGTRCPECGANSDPRVLTLRGWSPGSIATMRPGRMLLQVVLVFIFVGIYISTMTRGGRSVGILVYLGAILVWPLVQLLRSWLSGADVKSPQRLRFGADGFEQRDGAGPLKLTPWDYRMTVERKCDKHGRNSLTVRWQAMTFVLTAKSQLISFEFDGNPDHAQALQWQIREWISQSVRSR